MSKADPSYCPPPLRALPSERVVHQNVDGIAFHDPLGIAEPSFVPREFLPVLIRLDGMQSVAAIATAASRELRLAIRPADVAGLVAHLDERLLLHSERYERARDQVLAQWLATGVREAAHAGSAGYPADAAGLRRELERTLSLCRTRPALTSVTTGLIAPHIDLLRGQLGYGAAYGHLLASGPADLYVLFGTGHQGPAGPVAGLALDWSTPLGTCRTDRAFVAAVHQEVHAPRTEDVLMHRGEHSLEFQVLWLQFVHEQLRLPPPTVAAFLCGALPSGDGDPTREPWLHRLVASFRAAAAQRGGRVLWIAGADLAHLGPLFDDVEPVDRARCARLEHDDRGRLVHLTRGDAGAFHQAIEGPGNDDRVCSAPAITLCALLAEGQASLLHYGQALAEDGSQVVSFCAAAFTQ
jgi:hypothetical protein